MLLWIRRLDAGVSFAMNRKDAAGFGPAEMIGRDTIVKGSIMQLFPFDVLRLALEYRVQRYGRLRHRLES